MGEQIVCMSVYLFDVSFYIITHVHLIQEIILDKMMMNSWVSSLTLRFGLAFFFFLTL